MTRIPHGMNAPAMGTEPYYTPQELFFEELVESVGDDDELLEELFEEAGLDVDKDIDTPAGEEVIRQEAMRRYELALDRACDA